MKLQELLNPIMEDLDTKEEITLNEGIIDFLKRIWRSIFGKTNIEQDEQNVTTGLFDKNSSKLDLKDDLPETFNQNSKQKLARIMVRGLRLHQEAKRVGAKEAELEELLHNILSGKVSLKDFVGLVNDGVITKIYARVRERIAYKRRQMVKFTENKQ